MEEQDKQMLAQLFREYPVQEVIEVLDQVIRARTDELVELNLMDKAKELTLLGWHLNLVPLKVTD
jgi:AAA+ superfamily predicted ATPase